MQKYLYHCNIPGDLKLHVRAADSLQLDTVQFKRDFNDPSVYDAISRNIDLLHERKLFGTPTVVIGSKMHMDIRSAKQLGQLIDKQLKKR
jgi:2-hydroxychromene-2-carboxylate isomerase